MVTSKYTVDDNEKEKKPLKVTAANVEIVSEPMARYGNQEEKVFPYQTKVEYDQKCVKPTFSVFGSDYTKMIEQIGDMHDKMVAMYKTKGVPVAPLISIKEEE